METLLAWLRGELSPEARALTALAPALALGAYVSIGMLVFAIRGARAADRSHGTWLRRCFGWLMQPLAWLALWVRLPPGAVTTLATLLATGSAVAVAVGRMALGGWLFVAAGASGLLSGRAARAASSFAPRAAMLESVVDRYVEAAVLVGLAWFYRDGWVLLGVLAALVGSLLSPYVRARGEAAGVELAEVGLVQRPERMAILGLSLALSPAVEVALAPSDPRPLHRLAVAGVVVLAAATHISAVQRLIFAHHALTGTRPRPPRVLGRGGLARTVVSSAAATGSDFALVAVMVSGFALWAPAATFVGCVLGGIVNFTVNRIWAFASDAPTGPQALRYLFVTTSSAVLNSGLVAVFLLLPGVPYVIAWWLVRGAVFATWSFPLNRDYVFLRSTRRGAGAA